MARRVASYALALILACSLCAPAFAQVVSQPGGAGGGGGGGAVTVASGADVTEGASTDVTCGTTHSLSGCLYLILQGLSTATPAGTNTIGGTMPVAATTGGATPYHLAGGTAASTNSTSVKGSAGTLYSVSAINTTGTVYYLRLYDSASAPTCSSATGAVHSYPIPANTSGNGFTIPIGAVGEAYANGIGFCVTGGGSDTDNTNAATGVFINASYK